MSAKRRRRAPSLDEVAIYDVALSAATVQSTSRPVADEHHGRVALRGAGSVFDSAQPFGRRAQQASHDA